MKNLKLFFIQQPLFIYYTKMKTWLQEYWLKSVLILMIIFIVVKKDISFQFSMQDRDTNLLTTYLEKTKMAPAAVPITQANNQQTVKATTLGLPSLSDLNPFKATEEMLSEKEENLANSLSNLAFILNPTYAQRKGIAPTVVQHKNSICRNYIHRFSPVAVAEMRKYNIPASITLAQGLLESNAGKSRLTKANNNHFGIKCFSKNCSKNHCSNFTDDTHKDFFRKYDNAWESYRSHSLFLQNKRYKRLQQLDSKDYKGWARGLKNCGYATDKRYAEKLIMIIESLALYEYDI